MTLEYVQDDRQDDARVREELTRVSLGTDQVTRDGHKLPAGSTGTIVDVLAKGQAYTVEFARPFVALVTVEASDLENVVEG